MHTNPKKAKKNSVKPYFFAFLGSLNVKAARKMLMKLTNEVCQAVSNIYVDSVYVSSIYGTTDVENKKSRRRLMLCRHESPITLYRV